MKKEYESKTVMNAIEFVSMSSEEKLKGRTLRLTSSSQRNVLFERTQKSDLHPHQRDCLERIKLLDPASGIVFLPTGSGKTRIAIELMAKMLNENSNEDSNCRFIWASYPNNLIRQAMVRVFEQYHLFEKPPNLIWVDKDTRQDKRGDIGKSGLLTDHHIVFAIRDDLTNLVSDFGRLLKTGVIRNFLSNKRLTHKKIVLVYDECHQLGAPKLQKAFKTFFKKLGRQKSRFQFIGLSATPLPTIEDRHKLLEDSIFPLPKDPEKQGVKLWPNANVLVYHRVNNKELVDREILCPVNMRLQKSGVFNIPDEFLRSAEKSMKSYKKVGRIGKGDLQDFDMEFNNTVMCKPGVLSYLGQKIGDRFEELGKTLVFVYTTKAADELADILRKHSNVRTDQVFVVHSGLRDDSEEIKSHGRHPEMRIEKFKALGEKPAIMINVGMLTTGFDDPKIQSVFWPGPIRRDALRQGDLLFPEHRKL